MAVSGSVFTPKEREQLRQRLVTAASEDTRVIAAAHLGSAAIGRLDRWSDIDLALCLSADADLNHVLADWTARLHREHGAVITFDVKRGSILYRVFLLKNTLQVDLSFWPANEFRAVGAKFALIFGKANGPAPASVPAAEELIGMAWLYALHVRSSIARGRFLQAEYMLSGMRDNVLALSCIRYGADAIQGRGIDDLPEEVRKRAADCLACSIEANELKRAFRVTTDYLLDEIRSVDAGLANKLDAPLKAIVGSAE